MGLIPLEQLALFDIEKHEDLILDEQIAKTKRDYSHLLRSRPVFREDVLLAGSHLFRKLIANNLIELSRGKLEAKDYFTNPNYSKDLEMVCEFADIDINYLHGWVEQILNGAVCFNFRIADDSLKAIYNIAKKRPPFDSSVIEDWSIYYPKDALNKGAKK